MGDEAKIKIRKEIITYTNSRYTNHTIREVEYFRMVGVRL